MGSSLADFRIENDRIVVLSFKDGSLRRVRVDHLDEFLGIDDVVKVREALQLRQKFIRRVLPPTAIFVLVAAVVGMGGYDYHRYSQEKSAHGAEQQQTRVSPVAEPKNQTKPSAAQAPASTPAAVPAPPQKEPTTEKNHAESVPANSDSAEQGIPQNPAHDEVRQITNPVQKITEPVKHVVPTVLDTAKGLLH